MRCLKVSTSPGIHIVLPDAGIFGPSAPSWTTYQSWIPPEAASSKPQIPYFKAGGHNLHQGKHYLNNLKYKEVTD